MYLAGGKKIEDSSNEISLLLLSLSLAAVREILDERSRRRARIKKNEKKKRRGKKEGGRERRRRIRGFHLIIQDEVYRQLITQI